MSDGANKENYKMNLLKPKVKAGFSLIEIVIAITVFAGGLLVIIAVFPGALRLGASATADTRQTAFAENVLGFIQLKSSAITDYNKWQTNFKDYVKQDSQAHLGFDLVFDSVRELKNYFVQDETASYFVKIKRAPLDPTIWCVTVYCSDTPDIPATNCTPYQLSIRYRYPVP